LKRTNLDLKKERSSTNLPVERVVKPRCTRKAAGTVSDTLCNDTAECDPSSRWIIVELNEDTFLETHYEQVERVLRDELGSSVVYFLPVYKEKVQGKSVCYVLFDGYVFIQRTDEVITKIHKLRTEHIKGALFIDGSLRLVTGTRINRFKRELQEKVHTMLPQKGQRVIAKVGTFKNLEGEVLSVDPEKLIAIVRFSARSRVVDAPLNIVNISLITGT
jgi:transcription antitermination factor NusG